MIEFRKVSEKLTLRSIRFLTQKTDRLKFENKPFTKCKDANCDLHEGYRT